MLITKDLGKVPIFIINNKKNKIYQERLFHTNKNNNRFNNIVLSTKFIAYPEQHGSFHELPALVATVQCVV